MGCPSARKPNDWQRASKQVLRKQLVTKYLPPPPLTPAPQGAQAHSDAPPLLQIRPAWVGPDSSVLCSPQHLLLDSGWVELENVFVGGLLAAGRSGEWEYLTTHPCSRLARCMYLAYVCKWPGTQCNPTQPNPTQHFIWSRHTVAEPPLRPQAKHSAVSTFSAKGHAPLTVHMHRHHMTHTIDVRAWHSLANASSCSLAHGTRVQIHALAQLRMALGCRCMHSLKCAWHSVADARTRSIAHDTLLQMHALSPLQGLSRRDHVGQGQG